MCLYMYLKNLHDCIDVWKYELLLVNLAQFFTIDQKICPFLFHPCQVEKEAKQLQDTLSKEQLVQFQLLQSDSKKVEDQRTQFLNQLQAADAAKQGMEERIAELKTMNTQLDTTKVGVHTVCKCDNEVSATILMYVSCTPVTKISC